MRTHIIAAAAALLGFLPLAASAQEYPPDPGQPPAGQGQYQSDVGPGDQGPDDRGPGDQGPGDEGPGPGYQGSGYEGPGDGGNGPSYAQQPDADQPSVDEQIRGRIVDFDGGYNLTVRDDRGFVDNIQLHPGTIINPTGLTLAPGMVVSILGDNAGQYFSANEIDTPYSIGGDAIPVYEGHAWDYYGPTFNLDFFFGNVGWWHGGDFRGGYHYDGGARVYRESYRGGYRGGYGNGQRYNSGYGANGRGYQHGSYGSTQSSAGVHYGHGYNGNATTQASSIDPSTRRYETRGYSNNGYTGSHSYAPVNRTYSEAPARSYGTQSRTYGSYGTQSRAYGSYASGGARSYGTTRGYAPSGGGRSYSPSGGGRSYSQASHASSGGGNHGGGGHDGGGSGGGHNHR